MHKKTVREKVLYFALKYGLICDDIDGDIAITIPLSNREEIMRELYGKRLKFERLSQSPEKIRFVGTAQDSSSTASQLSE